MPIVHLTDRTLAGLTPARGAARTDYFDRTLPGFGVRVGAHRKTFIALYRTQQGKRLRRQTLGQYPNVSLATARERARIDWLTARHWLLPRSWRDNNYRESRRAKAFAFGAELSRKDRIVLIIIPRCH